MNIRKIDEQNNVTKLLIKGSNIAFLNSLRRTVMNNLPILAIEDVSIYENSSVMFDEYLAHRLAMLPVKTDVKTYKKGDKVKFVLEKEGPGIVYSKDIKCTDPKIEIFAKKVPIVKLKKGQKIKLEMNAVMGTGKEHAKWQPAIVAYNELPSISNTKECNFCKKCIEACPKDLLELKAKKIVLSDEFECILCGACRDACNKRALLLDYSDNTFMLTIESSGALTVKEILIGAADVLKAKVKELKKEISKL